MKHWTQPEGGVHGYLRRFLASGDSTFQHIAIWTLLQLLESEDKRLIQLIAQSDDVVNTIQTISEKNVESDNDEGDEGDGEVATLARRCLELLGKREGSIEG